MFDLIDYLQFPFRDKEWLRKMITGCLLLAIPFVNVLVAGYAIECIRWGMRGKEELPPWSNWEQLLKQGFFMIIIAAVYFIAPVLISILLGGIPIIGPVLTAALTLLAGALIPMAIVNAIFTDNLWDAFKLGEILYHISRVADQYAVCYLLMALVASVASAIIVALPIFAIIGILILFYCIVVYANFLGLIYSKSNRS